MAVQQIEVGERQGRFVQVAANGRRIGSAEWDHGKWIAHPTGNRSCWFGSQQDAIDYVIATNARMGARWRAALDRAIADGLDPVKVEGKQAAFFVESGSRPGIGYLVGDNGWTCTCPAGQGDDLCCKHRAAVRFVLGLLDVYGIEADPEPEPPAPATPEPCPRCKGKGEWWIEQPGHVAYREQCYWCGGLGQVA